MYKTGVRSMPRAIKKEVVKHILDFECINDIIPITQSDCSCLEKKIVNNLSEIKGLPSYWIISCSTQKDVYFIVFERLLNEKC